LLIDATERAHSRPTNDEKQRDLWFSPDLWGKVSEDRLCLKDDNTIAAKRPNPNHSRCSASCQTNSRTYGKTSNSGYIEHLIGTTRNGG
jgi:hypothetical protein